VSRSRARATWRAPRAPGPTSAACSGPAAPPALCLETFRRSPAL